MRTAGTTAGHGLAGRLVLFGVGLAACGTEVYSGREDVAAEAGEAILAPSQLATWVARSPSRPPNANDAGFVALAWIDYSLLADAVAGGAGLTDSVTAAQALEPDLTLLPLRRWHDSLIARRPRVAPDQPDTLFADDGLRVFQQIFLRIADPNDVRANTAVRERAESLMVRVRAPGADFSGLARQHSEDPTAPLGGWLPPSRRTGFLPEFVRGTWRIKPGETHGVITRSGFHIVRRPPLEEVRDRLRQYAESLATRRADSVYLDSLVAARRLALGTDVPERLRGFFNDPSRRTGDTQPLAQWEGGQLLLERAAIWIDLLPPRAYLDLRGTSDVLLERFTRELAQQFLLFDEAGRNGIGVTSADWARLYPGYQRGLGLSLGMLGADSSGGLPAAEREARVNALIDQLTSDSTRWRALPSALGAVLRARAGYRLHQRGLDRAVAEAATK
ncbi:MAG TPA: peptidylprolyl isomerase [Gemmatimonadales bacterium]